MFRSNVLIIALLDFFQIIIVQSIFLFPTRLTERTRNRRSRVINWYLGSIVDRELFRFVLFNFKCIEKSMCIFISLFYHLHELINIILINVNFLQLYIHIKLFQTVSKDYFTSTGNVSKQKSNVLMNFFMHLKLNRRKSQNKI